MSNNIEEDIKIVEEMLEKKQRSFRRTILWINRNKTYTSNRKHIIR